jgi:hypothetical protein
MQPQHFKVSLFEQFGRVPAAGIVPKLEQPMALKIKRIFCHLPHRLILIVERSIYPIINLKIKLPVNSWGCVVSMKHNKINSNRKNTINYETSNFCINY